MLEARLCWRLFIASGDCQGENVKLALVHRSGEGNAGNLLAGIKLNGCRREDIGSDLLRYAAGAIAIRDVRRDHVVVRWWLTARAERPTPHWLPMSCWQ